MKFKTISQLIFLSVGLGSSFTLHASKMGEFISHLGNVSNFNSSGSYQDQSAGHYTAGGMMVRQRQKTINPINIRLPSIGGSCGDFDIRFGGLSFLKGQETLEMLKTVATGSPLYVMQLALKSVSPQIEGLMSHLRSELQKLNSLMLNDCHMRQQLLSAVLPSGAVHDTLCMDMAQSGNNADYFGARDKFCKKPEQREKGVQEAKKKHQDLLAGEFNLVWNVLKKMPRYKQDKDLAQLIMSMTGTVLSQKENDGYKVTYLDPKIDEDRFLEANLRGGETAVLSCDETDKCLSVKNVHKIIAEKESLKYLIQDQIKSIRRKYMSETQFTQKEMVFLSDSVNLPIYKYIQVSAAVREDWPLMRSMEYIAIAILIKQFEEVAAEVLEAVSVLESVQIDTTVTDKFKRRLEEARSRLQHKMNAIDSREIRMLDTILKAKEREIMANSDLERTS